MKMNKTIAAMAMILVMVTATFVMLSPDSDGYTEGEIITIDGVQYSVTMQAGKGLYSDSELKLSNIYVCSSHISTHSFASCSKVRNVYLADNLTTIGMGAFRDCVNLVSIQGGSVTEIRTEAFENTGLQIIDIRGVGTIADDAFIETPLKLQVVDRGQRTLVDGVSKIVVETDVPIKKVDISGSTVTLWTGSDAERLSISTSSGEPVDVDYSVTNGLGRNSFTYQASTDYDVGLMTHVIDYPDGMGVSDETVPSDSADHTLQTPAVGSLPFIGWTTPGIEGTFTSLNGRQMSAIGERIVLSPSFGHLSLALDHSDVSSLSDASGLQTSSQFTYGSTYPDCPDVTGYRFVGWSVGDDTMSPGDPITNYNEHTAKSLWEPSMLLTLSYLDGDGNVLSSDEYAYGVAVGIAELDPGERDSERFVGWRADGTGSLLNPGGSIRITADTTMRPVYDTRDLFDVVLVDGDVTIATFQVYDGRTGTIPSDVPTREFHEFLGWNHDESILGPGDTVTVHGNLVLDAEWRELPTAVIDVDVPGFEATRVLVGTEFTIPAFHETKDHFDFMGWSTSENATEAEHAPESKLTIIEDTVLYQVWKAHPKVTVTYHMNEDIVQNPCLGCPITIDVEPPVREHFTFLGWSSEQGSAEAQYIVRESYTFDSDTVLYPVWEEHPKVTIEFDGLDAKLNPYKDETVVIDTVPETRDHFTFLGWSDYKNATEPAYAIEESYKFDSDIVLYPVWEEDEKVVLTFDATSTDKGTWTEMPYKGSEYTISAGLDDRDRFDFIGWSVEEGSTMAEFIIGNNYSFHSDTVLYPVWKEHPKATISFHDADVECTQYCDTPLLIEVTPSEREHFTFLGWSMDDGSAEAQYMVGESYTFDSDTVLYPVWLEDPKVTIEFYGLGVFYEHYADTPVTIDEIPETREHFTFLGWSDVDDSSEAMYAVGNSYRFDSDTVLYPIWVEHPKATITYVIGDSEQISLTEYVGTVVTIGQEFEIPEGKRLIGWSQAMDSVEPEFQDGSEHTMMSDLTLHPVLEDLPKYTVTIIDRDETLSVETVFEGTSITLPDVLPDHGIHKHIGWSTDDGTVHGPCSGVVVSSDLSFKSAWEEMDHHVITVHIDPIIELKLLAGQELTFDMLPDTTREHYRLLGWSTTEDGTADISEETSVTPSADVDVYPVWERIAPSDPDSSGSGNTGSGSSSSSGSGSSNPPEPINPDTDDDNEADEQDPPATILPDPEPDRSRNGGEGIDPTKAGAAIATLVGAFCALIIIVQMRRS